MGSNPTQSEFSFRHILCKKEYYYDMGCIGSVSRSLKPYSCGLKRSPGREHSHSIRYWCKAIGKRVLDSI